MCERHTSKPQTAFNSGSKDKHLTHFLQAVPYLLFSDKGLKNIAGRFNISIEDLKQRIAEFEKGGRNVR